MAARSFAISLGAGLLLSACAGGDDATDDTVEDTGSTEDTGEPAADPELTGLWDMVSSTYVGEETDSYSWPYVYTYAESGDVLTLTFTMEALEDGSGTMTYTQNVSYAAGGDDSNTETPFGFGWTRTDARTFDLAFEVPGVPATFGCTIAEDNDDEISCEGVDTDNITWTWNMTRNAG